MEKNTDKGEPPKRRIVASMAPVWLENFVLVDARKIGNPFGNRVNAVSDRGSERKMTRAKSQSQADSSRALRTLILFFKLLGLATLSYSVVVERRRTSCVFRYSPLGVAYNIALVLLMIASNYLSIPYTINMDYPNKTNLTVGIEILETLLGTVVICALLLSYCVSQRILVRIANRLTDVEHELDRLCRLYPSLRRRRVFRASIAVCVLNVCLLLVLLTSEYFAFRSSPVSWLTDIVPTFHVGWLVVQYCLLVTVVHANFVDVNRAIRSLSADVRPQSFYQTRRVVVSNSAVHQLLQLRDTYCHLCDVCQDVSDFYSVPILFGMTFTFLSLIYNGYYLISPLLVSDEILEYRVLTNTVFWLIFLIYPVLLLTGRITNTLHEMKRTADTVHDLLSCAIGSETRSEILLQLKQFSLQLLHRKIEFTANGYFTLDNSLFHSMAGAVTTYLVILVQFQMGSYSSKSRTCNCTR